MLATLALAATTCAYATAIRWYAPFLDSFSKDLLKLIFKKQHCIRHCCKDGLHLYYKITFSSYIHFNIAHATAIVWNALFLTTYY